MKYSVLLFCALFSSMIGNTQNADKKIVPAAERIETYLPLLKGKRLGIFANQTSIAGNTHLVDMLRKEGVEIKVIFGPEHGFRGTADAGEKVGNYIDDKTGIPVVSLYGNKRKPSAEDVKEVDLLLFDIQDVGVRFYTFISSMQEFMEASIDLGKPLLILDRPNPNGHYVDGPVLDTKYKSFVGMQPVPIVYGMTLGEFAIMLAKEQWLSGGPIESIHISIDGKTPEHITRSTADINNKRSLSLTVIKCANYNHQSKYQLPVRPSPNLPNIQSI